MDYKSEQDKLSTNPFTKSNGSKIPEVKKEKIKELNKQGLSAKSIAKEVGVHPTTVSAIRNQQELNGEFNHNTWKKNTAEGMATIVSSGIERLKNEINLLPVGQLPVAIAILTDKILALQDAPSVVVEHRLRVSHDDINKLIKGDVIDVKPLEQSDLTSDTK